MLLGEVAQDDDSAKNPTYFSFLSLFFEWVPVVISSPTYAQKTKVG